MISQLIRSYVLLVAVAIALFTVPVAFTLTDQLRGDTESSVEREASTMALLLGTGSTASCQALEEMTKAYEEDKTPITVQVTATEGCTETRLSPPHQDAALTKATQKGEETTDWG